MTIFPENDYYFQLVNESESLERLKRRTEISSTLSSKRTDKSFIGTIHENEFKLISSEIGKGAVIVMNGIINQGKGAVKTEINKVFKILFIIMCFFPFIAVVYQAITQPEVFSQIFILIAFLQILFLRLLMGILFRQLSKQSLRRLSDVLDIESLRRK